MKSFLKYTLATITGIFLTSLIFFFFLIIFIAATSSDKPVETRPNTILYMKLTDRIVDRAQESPFEFISIGLPAIREMGLNSILENIRKAKKDDNISGIYLEMNVVNAGMGSTEEIRNALLDFKESGKFIIAYGDQYSQKSYYLASVADSLYMNPEGYFFLTGIGSQIMFYKGALDKLGIDVQVIREGEYKSFVEPYTQEKMSPENREQILHWIGSIWQHMLRQIGEQRNIDPAELDRMADELAVRSARTAHEKGLIDRLVFKDEVIRVMKELTGTDERKDLRAIRLRKYTRVPSKREFKGITKDKVAVIYAHGDIVQGNTGEGTVASDRISRAIRKARRDSTIKAIVLRVNSGGGGVLASNVIYRETWLASRTKPLVASVGDVAASAGYYILAPADTILAHPNSVTGSIGVFAMLPNIKPFMNKKLGLSVDVAKTNEYFDLGSPFRPLSDNERAVFRELVSDSYNSFLEEVADGRSMSIEAVDAIGKGRVWSGENALENGLIDRYGGLHDAIEIAAGLAGLEKYRVTELPRLEDPIDQFIRELTEYARNRMVKRELGQFYHFFETMDELEGLFGLQARLPFRFELN